MHVTRGVAHSALAQPIPPDAIAVFVGPAVHGYVAMELPDAVDELTGDEIVYLSVECAQRRGWLPEGDLRWQL